MTKYHVDANVNILLHKFHWQFPITYCGFWLVNILLRKFDTSSKKEMKMIKTQIFFMENNKKCQERVCCCSIDCLSFQVVQIKQVDCKMSTKDVNNYK